MARFKEGDRVRVKARQASEKEALEGHYAPFLAGATGTILKIYDAKQIAVNLDIDSLPEEVRQRHAEQQEAMYRRWLDSLSEEARNRLTDEEKAFRLNYVALLTESDLESPPPAGSPRKRGEPTTSSKTVPPASGGTSRRGSKQPTTHPTEGQTSRRESKQLTAPPTEGQTPRRGSKQLTVPPASGQTPRRGSKQPTMPPTEGRTSQQAEKTPTAHTHEQAKLPRSARHDNKAERQAAPRAEKAVTIPTDAPSRKPRKQAKTTQAPPAPARPTPEQLDLMEEAYLKARQRKAH